MALRYFSTCRSQCALHNLEVLCSHQALYKRVTEYLELEQRITVLNNRFEVLTELLNIVREHENNLHIARLEWIVIWLIVIEVIVGLLECASILGFVKEKHGIFNEEVRIQHL